MTCLKEVVILGEAVCILLLANHFALPLCGVKIECLFFMMEVMVIQYEQDANITF
jgi:hypothetical protein